jgi:quercetin dioxygenase-like cupin family protein
MKQQPSSPEIISVKSDDMSATYPEPGLTRRIGAYNDKLMLAEHRMQKGWIGARHSHPQEQLVYVVQGRIKVVAGDTAFEAGAGDSFVVRGGIEHEAAALEDSLVVDVFTPSREEYR